MACFAIILLPPVIGNGDDFLPESFTNAQFVEYERKLNALLKTRADEEKKFVNQIILNIVNVSFQTLTLFQKITKK